MCPSVPGAGPRRVPVPGASRLAGRCGLRAPPRGPVAGAAAGSCWQGLVAFVSAPGQMLPESGWGARVGSARCPGSDSPLVRTCPGRHPRVPGLLGIAFPAAHFTCPEAWKKTEWELRISTLLIKEGVW